MQLLSLCNAGVLCGEVGPAVAHVQQTISDALLRQRHSTVIVARALQTSLSQVALTSTCAPPGLRSARHAAGARLLRQQRTDAVRCSGTASCTG